MVRYFFTPLLVIFLLFMSCEVKDQKSDTSVEEIIEIVEEAGETKTETVTEISEAKEMFQKWIAFSKETLLNIESLNENDLEGFDKLFDSFMENAELFAEEEAVFISKYPDFDFYSHPELQAEWELLKSINARIIELRGIFHTDTDTDTE